MEENAQQTQSSNVENPTHSEHVDQVDDTDDDTDMSETSSVGTADSYDSATNESNFEIWDQRIATKIMTALENLLTAMHLLHEDGGCCDSFTVMVKAPSRYLTIVTSRITLSSLLPIRAALQDFCTGSNTKTAGWTQPLATSCFDTFAQIGLEDFGSSYLRGSLGKTLSPARCLHLCALILQVASVGLVTYSRGHSRDFYNTSLSRSIEAFIFWGSDFNGPTLCAERVELNCMGKMLGRKIWVFHDDKGSLGSNNETFFLSTTIGNLLDTWGGRIACEDRQLFLEIGGGLVISAERASQTVPTVQEGEIYCHWASEGDQPLVQGSLVTLDTQLLIGATEVNENCKLTVEACQAALPLGALRTMGTTPTKWRTRVRGFGLGGGSHGVTATASVSQVKEDGRNWKTRTLQAWKGNPSLQILNLPYGLELSLCTGIARRVALREFFYGEVLKYFEAILGTEWGTIKAVAESVAEKSDAEFFEVLKTLTKKQRATLRKATDALLEAMRYTGVGEDGHTLTLWWPEKNVYPPRGVKFVKQQYSGTDPWISMIKESETCAVFGMVTPRCLEHHDVKKCRNTAAPAICQAVEKIMLHTALVPATVEFHLQPLSYSLGERYVLWQRKDMLCVVQAAMGLEGVVRVNFIPGIMPPNVWEALRKKREAVREREAISDKAQDVLVL
jgi:hypothetical protein